MHEINHPPKNRLWRSTRRQLASCLALMVLIGPVNTAVAALDAQGMLVASDLIRNPSQPFRVTVTLSEFEKGVQVNGTTLVSYARTLDVAGQFVSIMRFTQPVRDAGKVMLKSGSDLWFYDPGTKAAVRISPQQRLIGQASNGDVVTVNFARDYAATLVAEETIQDGERQKRRANKLLLMAKTADASYGSIELWVDADTQAPLKGRFIADSGRLLKTAYYRRFQSQLGAFRPTETVIIDALESQSVTIVRMADYAFRDVPAAWFQRDYLSRFNAD